MSPTTTQSSTCHQLACRMQAEPAALERVCQVIRIRGFRIDQMQVVNEGEVLAITLQLTGDRPVSMLCSQIEKLHSVLTLTLAGQQAPARQTA
ncbi:ACT domain-containing protein [Marinobacter caseinilyticus]|uniref:ACT domain-containing protein n=1 Tax=Marinobacter caseinilyticus TaxID=2692195 RepID=UPI001F430153|nr:ACT domain-containing protein [Marinobacter caseinilyticus]